MTRREIYLRETGRTHLLIAEGFIRFGVHEGGKMQIIAGTRRVKTIIERKHGAGIQVQEKITVKRSREAKRPEPERARISGKRTTLADLIDAAWARQEARARELEA